ncbi:MAG: M23 family metallopeptidase [Alistipes sp.]|nr:M23 family metallopeptidase [Alistipes sp.]
MRFFEKIALWWHNIFRKRRISISDPETSNVSWYTHLSVMGIITLFTALVFIIFGVLLLLVAYTPILDTMPGYRTDASRSRETLLRTLIRIDSLERKMNDMLIYNENRILVVEGKTPATRTMPSDTLLRNKSIVAPSRADSLLRQQMESDAAYTLRESSASRRNINAVKPMEGIISERFNAKIGLHGIRMVGTPESQIVATAEGTIVTADWSPEQRNCIVIQHDNGMMSVYRALSSTIVSKGQRVAAGEVIGYSATEEDAEALFEFELWSNGKPLDPESHIIF